LHIKPLPALLPVGDARLGVSLWHDGVLGPGVGQIAGLLLKQPMLYQLNDININVSANKAALR
jgi:hypothetical protein